MISNKYKYAVVGILAAGLLMLSATVLANTVKQYILVEPSYPVYVNDVPYESVDLPILNYEGHTYIPMKAVGDMLGASVEWNEEHHRAEISFTAEAHENTAFRNIEVTGTNGSYVVTGEARVYEAMMQYAVSDGHNYLIEDSHMVEEGGPAWSPFTLNLALESDQLPLNGTLTLELFEYSAKDGEIIHMLVVPLESFQ